MESRKREGLTPAKLQVLCMLLEGPCSTTKHTTARQINGRVAACLRREKLVYQSNGLYHINDAGRAALTRETCDQTPKSI